MKNISVVPVTSRLQMRKFLLFSLKLYKKVHYAVPELFMDTKNSLTKGRNPALDFCDLQLFLAYKEDKVAGRVAALINPVANERWGKKQVRFGWIDFIEDYDVCKALLDRVAEWGRERGMTSMEGPLGFTDLDREGALIDGFSSFGTMSTIYNFPYYIDYYERYGFTKSVDWLEFRLTVPDRIDEKQFRCANLIKERYGITVKRYKSHKAFKNEAAYNIFKLINECYDPLHGVSQLNPKQIQYYIDAYIPYVDLDLIPLIYDKEGNLIGVGLLMPSLAGAIQRAHGMLLPLGWLQLLYRLYVKHSETIEFLLIAIKPEWQGRGLNALMFSEIFETVKKKGFKYCETNCNLEDNKKIINLWSRYEHEQHKRRRAFVKDIVDA